VSTPYPEGQSTGPLQAPPPPPQYPAQPYGHPYQPYGAPYGQPGFDLQRPRTNVMAILGLVFAFVCSPLGIVFSAIGLSQIKKRREAGKGLAIAGLVLSIVFVLIGLLMILLVLPALMTAAKQTATAEAAPPARSAPVQRAVEPALQDAHGIVRACQVIIPALTKTYADLGKATTEQEYLQLLTTVRTTIETTAHTSTDPVFVQDVLTLSQDLKRAGEVTEGQDTAPIDKAIVADGKTIDDDCGAAGYVPN
jgi:hypothetical protein